MKITWHVDDLKLSHSGKDIVDALTQWTNETYEYITKLKISRVKIHDYLAMTMYYTTSGEVEMYMKEYIDKIILEFPYM